MIFPTRIILIAICILFFAYIINLVFRKKLMLKYSLLWLALSIVVALCAIFPSIIYSISDLLGFITPSNFIFLVAIFFLLTIALSLSVIASRQTANIKRLVQEIALLKYDSQQKNHRE